MGVFLMREVGRILILQIVQVLAKERWGFFEDSGHLLGCRVNQDHLRNVHDVSLVWFFRQVAFVNLKRLEVNAAD